MPPTRLLALALVSLATAFVPASPARADSAPPNDDWAAATIVTGVPFQFTESTTSATVAPDESPWFFHNTVWFSYTPSENRRVALSTLGTDYAADTLVYTGLRESRIGVSDCSYPVSGVLWCNLSGRDA